MGCVPVTAISNDLKSSYQKFALISTEEQMARVKLNEDTLLVFCDWSLWQAAVRINKHCVHFEQGLAEWSGKDDFDSELMIHSNQWVYQKGIDVTLFKGVSLGKLFHNKTLFFFINTIKLQRALIMLIDRFKPDSIEFFDFAYEISVLDPKMRKILVQAIAQKKGVAFVSCEKAMEPGSGGIGEDLMSTKPPLGLMRRIVAAAYVSVISRLTGLRVAFSKKPNIMFLIGGNIAAPLFGGYNSHLMTPMVQVRTLPKTPATIMRCLIRGVNLFSLPQVTLTSKYVSELENIRERIRNNLSEIDTLDADLLRTFIETNLLSPGKLESFASEVLQAHRVMNQYHPKRLVVDGVRNAPIRQFIELAEHYECAVDYIWHSPQIPQHLKFDALSGDTFTRPIVNRCLSWGAINNQWLDMVAPEIPRIKAGTPLSTRYANLKTTRLHNKPRLVADAKILILQYTPILSDLRGLNAHTYQMFVELVGNLNSLGCRNVHFKLHPGPGRWTTDYFYKIAGQFGIECRITKTDRFQDCVDWADAVVGPVQSGAFFETLAAGKRYFPIIFEPNSLDMRYYDGYPIYRSTDEVLHAIQDEFSAETNHAHGADLINRLYSTIEFPDGSARIWQILDQDLTETVRA